MGAESALGGSDLNSVGLQRPTDDDFGQIDAVNGKANAEAEAGAAGLPGAETNQSPLANSNAKPTPGATR
jgi:hypothetical protein